MNPIASAIFGAIQPLLGPLLDRIPNANERARAKEDFEKALLDAVSAQTMAQLEVNKTEAQHSSIFVAGWRPFIGWVCGAGLAYGFILRDLIAWGLRIYMPELEPPPTLQLGELLGLLGGMLGLGGLRTFEKIHSVDRSSLREP